MIDLRDRSDVEATLVAMRSGWDAIVQAPLESDRFRGRARGSNALGGPAALGLLFPIAPS